MARRQLLELSLGATTTLLLFGALPQSSSHPLRAMVALLPLVAALFSIATRAVRAPHVPVEPALWLAWVVLALVHHRLGLAGSATIVAVGGGVLAAARVLVIARGLRRAEKNTALATYAAALAFLLFLWPWSTAGRPPDGDEPYYLLLTHSLAEDLDVDLADQYRERAWADFSSVEIAPQPGDPVGPGGEIWSRHGAFLPLLLAPFYSTGGVRAAEVAMIALAAALAAALHSLVRRRLPATPDAAAAAWSLVLLAPPLLIYSGRFWVEVPAALAVALALWAMPGRRGGAPGRRDDLVFMVALAALPLLKLRFLALALPLAVLGWRRLAGGRQQRGQRIRLLLAFSSITGAVLLWNQLRFGNPLRLYDRAVFELTAVPPFRFALGLSGLFFDIAYGLFAVSPLWLLLVPAFAEGARNRRLPSGELLALAPYLLFIVSRREWYGGWSPPFRYGLALMPVLALLLAPLLARRPRSAGFRVTVAALVAATAISALIAFARPAWTFSLADGTSRGLAELSTLLVGDLARFSASAIRPRAATWIWIIAAPAALWLAWRLRGARRSMFAAPALGVAIVLAGGASWILAANRLPTSRVEVEDAWVLKEGGALHPERWKIDRTRETGGWAMVQGATLRFAPVTGGERCRIRIRGLYRGDLPSHLRLVIALRGEILAELEPAQADTWTTLSTPSLAWARGGELEIRAIHRGEEAAQDAHPDAVPLWIVDRLELDWS